MNCAPENVRDVSRRPFRRRPRFAANPAVVAALAIAAIAAATLAGAWFFQLVLDIRPCPLCLEQRYAYYLALPLALRGGVRRRAGRAAAAAAGRALRCFCSRPSPMPGSAAITPASNGSSGRGRPIAPGRSVDLGSAGTLLQRLDTVKVIRCDEVQWRFLGLSLAGYNVLISLVMAAIALWGIVAAKRGA